MRPALSTWVATLAGTGCLFFSGCDPQPKVHSEGCPEGMFFKTGTKLCSCNKRDEHGHPIGNVTQHSGGLVFEECSRDIFGPNVSLCVVAPVTTGNGLIVSDNSTACVSCPRELAQCTPSGCEEVMQGATSCPVGFFCAMDGHCRSCEGSCGTECGACPMGDYCLDGKCSGQFVCSTGPTFGNDEAPWACSVAAATEASNGGPCYCPWGRGVLWVIR